MSQKNLTYALWENNSSPIHCEKAPQVVRIYKMEEIEDYYDEVDIDAYFDVDQKTEKEKREIFVEEKYLVHGRKEEWIRKRRNHLEMEN